MDLKELLDDVQKIQEETAVLMAKRNSFQNDLDALLGVNPENCGVMFALLLPGRITRARFILKGCQEQIDFNIAFCSHLLTKATAALNIEVSE